jgi:hypothetical protein
MARILVTLSALAMLSVSALARAAEPAIAPEPGVAAPADDAVRPDPEGFAYGPILSHDPLVRGRIKRLYREQWDYNRETDAQLAQISASCRAETDPDLQMVLQNEAVALKKAVEIHNMELGLEIARLNGDANRVADFERALDQLLNPEKYRPAPVDPSIAEERARQMGLR